MFPLYGSLSGRHLSLLYLPAENYGHLTDGDREDARRCTSCGACSYACPAGLPLTGAVLSAARRDG